MSPLNSSSTTRPNSAMNCDVHWSRTGRSSTTTRPSLASATTSIGSASPVTAVRRTSSSRRRSGRPRSCRETRMGTPTTLNASAWAPSEFCKYDPDEELFWAGQLQFSGSITGFKNMFAAAHQPRSQRIQLRQRLCWRHRRIQRVPEKARSVQLGRRGTLCHVFPGTQLPQGVRISSNAAQIRRINRMGPLERHLEFGFRRGACNGTSTSSQDQWNTWAGTASDGTSGGTAAWRTLRNE